MTNRKASQQTIVLPWERRGGIVRRLRLGRARPILFAIAAVILIALVATRERQKAGVRATRAALLMVQNALDVYRADHGGKCPAALEDLEKGHYLGELPVDAWGHHLRLLCPSRREGRPYDLLSDGPDGLPGGLDRVE